MATTVLTLTEMKKWIGGAASSADDSLLERMEAQTLDAWKSMTGWWIGEPRAATERIVGGGSEVLYLEQPPLSITSVEVRSAFGGWATLIDDPASDLEVDGRMVYWPTGTFPRAERPIPNIKVVYQEGLNDPMADTPGDVKRVLLEWIETAFRDRVTVTPGFFGSEQVQLVKPLSKIAQQTVAKHTALVGT